jgi:hypothetical protein
MTTPPLTIKVGDLKPHSIADIFPMLPEDSIGFQAILDDIKANGLQQPIWLYEGQVLEGRHRVRILQLLGRDELEKYEQYKDYVGNDPIGFVLSANLHRRHLNESQRAMVAAKLADLGVGANQHTKGGTSIDAASKLLNVGRASIDRAKVVLAKGDPSLIKDVEGGNKSVSSAANEVKQPEQPSPDANADATAKSAKRATKSTKTPFDRFEAAWEKLDLTTQQAFVETKYNDLAKLMKEVDRKAKKAA